MWADSDDDIAVDKKIYLEVGGALYCTLESTLKKSPFFQNATIPEDEFIFIDRDPIIFCYILNFLRTNKLYLSGSEERMYLECIKTEAMYFELNTMADKLDAQIKALKQNTDVNNNKHVTDVKHVLHKHRTRSQHDGW